MFPVIVGLDTRFLLHSNLQIPSRVTPSPGLDLDQSCQAEEQAKFNSIGGVFLGSSSILHTSVLLGHSFPSTFKPSDSSRLTPLLLQF